ncbi:flavin reductase family protein [Arthrobacter sp. STN4]|uniref:flavin reductase family protein n=1 Tax=Arthrobacter sp. STN4 TaxID=2923276 RepID=UPI002119F406|nr:flavin reductase family protein [Arthrobacter sp. STN4]MCQ9163337.1 flavin reductase family protein [Arthrobacter sp. STN4]
MTVQAATDPTWALTADFKAAFGGHPAGVAVITADSGTGPVGVTASSVASVSAQPPILAFSLASRSGSAAALADADSIVVHLLTAADLSLARTFASPTSERFAGSTAWTRLPTGEPLLGHAGFALRCEILSRTPAGASLLVAASVVGIIAPDAPSQGAPLVYHARAYHALDGSTVLPGA